MATICSSVKRFFIDATLSLGPRFYITDLGHFRGSEHDRTLFAYNAWRVRRPATDLIIVTDLASVWWLAQCGYSSTVSLMGSSCSDEQARIISGSVAEDGCTWVLAEAAERCVPNILARLAPHRCVRWAKVPEGPPTACTPGDLAKLLWPV